MCSPLLKSVKLHVLPTNYFKAAKFFVKVPNFTILIQFVKLVLAEANLSSDHGFESTTRHNLRMTRLLFETSKDVCYTASNNLCRI